ncbi:hypothetical protein BH23PLA1_BH23PLA1_05640 [soil metagenome]
MRIELPNKIRDLAKAQVNPVRERVFVVLAALVVLLVTEPFLAIVWDEGYTLGREARVRAWFRALADPEAFSENWRPPTIELVQPDREPPPGRAPVRPPTREQVGTRAGLLEPGVIAWFWPFAREEPHGHPPFYAIIGLVGDVLTPWRTDLDRARLGPMIVFSLVAGGIYGFIARRYGRGPALLAVTAWLFQPRLFAHAHYAAYDALLTSLWVGAILAFALAVERPGKAPRWGWVLGFGGIGGLAAATKFTAWFLPLPFLAWTVMYGDRRGLLTLLASAPAAALTVFACIPIWWADPIDGLGRFFESNLSRAETIVIATQFLGTVYQTPVESLPWYNTIVWTVLVTPVGLLALAMVGVVRSLRRFGSERFGVLVVGHWAFLLILRALPNVPGHDGVRLFLPAFGCLALASGLGAAWVLEGSRKWGRVILGAAILEGVLSVALMMPVPLSYYSPLAGGLPGAARLGMEPTYYWDALTPEVLDWLNENTPPGQAVAFANYSTSWLYLRQTGQIKVPVFSPHEQAPIAWYIVQNRPGNRTERDQALIRSGRPEKVFEKWGVPLIWVFSRDQVEAIRPANGVQPEPKGPGRAGNGSTETGPSPGASLPSRSA